jgi:hypothetical protein
MIRLHNLTLAAAARVVASQWTAPTHAHDQRNVPKPPPQLQNKLEVPSRRVPINIRKTTLPKSVPAKSVSTKPASQNQQRPVENSVRHPPGQPLAPIGVTNQQRSRRIQYGARRPTAAPRSVSAKPAAVHGEFNTAPSEPAATPEHPRGRKSCRGLVASLQRRATDAAA